MKLRVLGLAVALAACGQSPEQAPEAPAAADPFSLHIEIGRYGAMLHQVRDLSAERPGSAEPDVENSHELMRNLRETVWELNLERSRLCAKGLFAEVACAPAYEPVWISEPATAEVSLADIQSRADALGEEVGRLWGAVCEDARARASEDERDTVCAIE